MHRAIRTIAFWICVGLLLSLGVAWGSAAWRISNPLPVGSRETQFVQLARGYEGLATESWNETSIAMVPLEILYQSELARLGLYGLDDPFIDVVELNGVVSLVVPGGVRGNEYTERTRREREMQYLNVIVGTDGKGKVGGQDLLPYWFKLRLGCDVGGDVFWAVQIDQAFGWPLRAVRSTSLGAPFVRSPPHFLSDVEGGLLLNGPMHWPIEIRNGKRLYATHQVWPMRPIVLGLLGDSGFWAAGVWLACWLVRRVGKGTRASRRLCTHCGYRLDRLARCPECGWVNDSVR